jgi:hypothetical protein
MGPDLGINVEPILRNHVERRVELTLLLRKLVVGHWCEPDVDVEADLMAGVAGEHGATARLGHVADQEPVPTNLPGIVGEPLNEGDEPWVSPIAIARHPHDLPTLAGDGQLGRAGETAVVIGANRPRGAVQGGCLRLHA